jgi:hypothetical protein
VGRVTRETLGTCTICKRDVDTLTNGFRTGESFEGNEPVWIFLCIRTSCVGRYLWRRKWHPIQQEIR